MSKAARFYEMSLADEYCFMSHPILSVSLCTPSFRLVNNAAMAAWIFWLGGLAISRPRHCGGGRALRCLLGFGGIFLWAASASALTSGDYTYTDNGTAVTITAYTGAGGAVTIPDAIGGRPVTSIGNAAFYQKSSVTSVAIPRSVTTIGNYAFSLCTVLTSVTIATPSSLVSLGANAFENCTALSGMSIPSGVTTLGNDIFGGCTSLASISIPTTVTSIGTWAFNSCRSLTSITIPSGVTAIGEFTFIGCAGLTSMTIPSSVTSIGDNAFNACTSLTRISFLGNAPIAAAGSFFGVPGYGLYTFGTTGWTNPYYGLTMTVFGFPTVTTPTSASIATTSVILGGNVTSDGGATVTTRGVVYALTSANSNPRLGGSGVTTVAGTGTTGAFTVSVTGLTANSGYSYAAYATNSIGTNYTPVSTFTTAATAPTVTSPTSASIASTTATLGGSVTSDGGATITARGVVYAPTSTSGTPRIGGTGVTNVTGAAATGTFTLSASGLTPGTGYSYAAYATNSAGTTYSTTGTFATSASAPTVTAPTVDFTAGTLGGNVTADGGATITARGVVYAITSANSNPQIGGAGVIQKAGTGTTGVFTVSPTGLAAGTAYSYAAYATNSVGTTYATGTFTTPTAATSPTVTSPTSASITNTTATLGGAVTADGGATITARGIVYAPTALNASPRIGGTSVNNVAGTGTTGVFSVSAAGLTAGTAYSYAAYATNSVGTTYSATGTFTTQTAAAAPTVTLQTSGNRGVLIGTTVGGNVTSDGGAAITARGVVVARTSANSNPQLGGPGVNAYAATGTTGSFTVNANGLTGDSQYSYAAYATNSAGTTYTTVSTFTLTSFDYEVQGSEAVIITANRIVAERIIPSTLDGVTFTRIAPQAFVLNAGMTSVTIPSSVTSIGAGAFYNCDLTSVTIPSGVTSIGIDTFHGCNRLSNVTIPSGVTSIGSSAFEGCTGLTSVTIPSSVISIGPFAFEDCTGLTSVTITSGVQFIEEGAFAGCTSLRTVTIPRSITKIETTAFGACTGLTRITFLGDAPVSSTTSFAGVTGYGLYTLGATGFTNPFNGITMRIIAGDFIVSDNGTAVTILEYTGAGGALTIPSTIGGRPVMSIAASAFSNNISLTSVTIPSSVTSIGNAAFQGCTRLTSAPIPSGVTSIGEGAFLGCAGLTSVTIPSGVTTIKLSAFLGCTGFTSLTIPSTVTTIEGGAFFGCTGLTSIYFAGNAPAATATSFSFVKAPGTYQSGTTGWISPYYGLTMSPSASSPTITTQPSATSATAGTAASFSVSASGTAPLSYQWRKDGTAIAGATSGTYTISTVATSDAGSYTVAVTNTAGSVTSNAATLTVTAADAAPTLKSQPVGATINLGQNSTFSVGLVGTGPFTYQWKKDGATIAGATYVTLRLVNVTAEQAGNYSVVVTNTFGAITSNAAALTVNSPLTLASNPTSRRAAIGDTLAPAFSVSATAAAGVTLTYQWRKDGVNILGATSATLGLTAIKATDFGTYSVTITSLTGTLTSTGAVLSLASDPVVAPIITRDPTSVTINPGSSLILSVAATGSPAPTYQWQFNGASIPGANAATLVLTDVIAAQAGTYNVVVTNSGGTATSKPATVAASDGFGRQLNLSTRGYVGTGGDILIPGFVIAGNGAKRLLIRAAGPALSQFGVSGVLADPQLAVFKDSNQLFVNDNWSASMTNATGVTSAGISVGAFAFTEGSKDAALVISLEPGAYTIQVSGVGATTGKAIVEVYDLDVADANRSRLINLATRALVQAGAGPLISGFVVQGAVAKAVLIRATGPALAGFGVFGTLAMPKLTLFDDQGKPILENTGWESSGISDKIIAALQSVGAFGLTRGTADSVILAVLAPGAYTAQVIGADGGSGVTLVEVYELP